jgi:formylglycine-generating enzyme required for sulfatase activity/large-conductance mechanosensitive channel
VGIYESEDMNAFATGMNKSNSLVSFSTGLLEGMNGDEIAAVAAHEISHIANGDMITMTIVQSAVNALVLLFSFPLNMVKFYVHFTSKGDTLDEWMCLLITIIKFIIVSCLLFLGNLVVKAFSRHREFIADRYAAKLTSAMSMSSALRVIGGQTAIAIPAEQKAYAAFKISSPATMLDLFSTHPSVERRIEALDHAETSPLSYREPFWQSRFWVLAGGIVILVGVIFGWHQLTTVQITTNKEISTPEMDEAKRQAALIAAVAEQKRQDNEARVRKIETERQRLGKVREITLPGGTKIELLCCLTGTFKMGSPVDEAGRGDDELQHQVTLTNPFWLGKYEVTQMQWRAVMENNLSKFKGDSLPVDMVSWNDAVVFCQKLTEQEQIANRLPTGYEYRLPTEAEWEYACQTGDFNPVASTCRLDDLGWYCENSETTTHPVGQKRPNAWGLYDMHGNVMEWCLDWYGDYPNNAVVDPIGPATGTTRVTRGGNWRSIAVDCRIANREGGGSDD